MSKNKKLSHDEVSYFCEQLSLVIESGMPLSEGVEMIAETPESGRAAAAAKTMAAEISGGKTLADAMEAVGVFPKYAVNMVKIGTLSGRLDDVLKGLSEYYEKMADRLRNIRSAILHPFILILMMTAVMVVLIIQVIPMFSDIFGQFDSSVRDVAGASVQYAYTTGIIILIVLVAILVISATVALLSKIHSVRSALAGFASKFFLTRKAARIFSQAKFSGAMSMMVSSGIEGAAALENAGLVMSDKNMVKKISDCHDKVVEGASFADVINESGILPPIYSRSLKMAYKSGAFDEAWKKISERCNEEADVTSENLVAIIEPVLIAVMAVMIGAILLTVMLPMLDIMTVIS